jgi:creatinine amidohydrolase
MQQNTGIDLSLENYGKVKEKQYAYAVLPWGATEPHNYHLPYLTDCYFAYAIAKDAVEKALLRYAVRGMVLPYIALGSQNPGQREIPFCIHARYETQKNILTDIVASLNRQGLQNLFILNGHGGNYFKNMIRDLTVDYPRMLIACCDVFNVVPQTECFENRDDHAGEMETSLIMHYYPELVDLGAAGTGVGKPFRATSLNEKTGWIPRDWNKVSDDTGIGNPEKASAAKGKRYAEAITDKIALLFKELVGGEIYL